jgi:endonuclease/exonuclease/phosphatase family metal-dependent hydrolase
MPDMRVRGILAITAAVAVALPAAAIAKPPVPAAAPSVGATPLCGVAEPKIHGLPRVPDSITVASYNMLHGLTTDGDRTLEARLSLTVDQIAKSGVDVVGLQEVEESTNHGLVIKRLATALANKMYTPWWWCWFRTEPHAPGAPDTRPGGGDPLSNQFAKHYNGNDANWYEGAAVLSRHQIVASAVHRLPGEDYRGRLTGDCKPPFDEPTCVLDLFLEPRAAVWARVLTPFGAVSLTSAHTSGSAKQHSDLVQWARTKSGSDKTALLVCDCNSLPTSKAQATIRAAGWVDTMAALHRERPTADQEIHAAVPTATERIDYVFLRTGSQLHLADSRLFMNKPHVTGSTSLWPSDHYGVIDTLE